MPKNNQSKKPAKKMMEYGSMKTKNHGTSRKKCS